MCYLARTRKDQAIGSTTALLAREFIMNRLLFCLVASTVLWCNGARALEYGVVNIADRNSVVTSGQTLSAFANLAVSGDLAAFRGTFGFPTQSGICVGGGEPK
jgi:hypothetical protein